MTQDDDGSAPMLGSHGGTGIMSWEHADQIMQEQRAEIARLRLTDEEREAIADAIDVFAQSAIHIDNEADRRRAETLRGLLRRLR